MLGDTAMLRADSGLPENLIVVCVHEDGAYCLAMNRRGDDGECPVVNFERGSVQHDEVLTLSFGQWLVEFQLQPWLDEPA